MYEKVFFTILILYLLRVTYLIVKENFNNTSTQSDIVFLSDRETMNFLIDDVDNYIKNMTNIDLYARQSVSANDYINKITNCACCFSEIEKIKLIRCAHKADLFLKNFKYKDTLDCKEIANIKWKFALTQKYNNYEYEDGLPHTRQDIIFLSKYIINESIAIDHDDSFLISTLIHEKVHLYQRYNNIDKLIFKMGYVEVSKSYISEKMLKLRRSNPDINDKIYSKNHHVIIFYYKNNKPRSINDVENNNFTIEHPFEEIAYDISNEYTKKSTIKRLENI